MSNIRSVVEGEASESDSEDVCEFKVPVTKKSESDLPHGAAIVVAGEAPESDEETTETHSGATLKEEPQIGNKISQSNVSNTNVRDSLLMKKLVESNTSFRNNLVNLLKSTVQSSLEQLTEAEKLLVNSQIRVQRASGSIRAFSSNGTLISNKLVNSSTYLPDIHIPDDPQ